MCVILFYWSLALYIFTLLPCNASFMIVKNSCVREKVSDVNKSLCKNICLVSLRLCTSPLVCASPLLTLFTSLTTPSTPRHVRGRKFPTLDIWQSSNKFTGKSKTQINVYVYIYIAHHLQGQGHISIYRNLLNCHR